MNLFEFTKRGFSYQILSSLSGKVIETGTMHIGYSFVFEGDEIVISSPEGKRKYPFINTEENEGTPWWNPDSTTNFECKFLAD